MGKSFLSRSLRHTFDAIAGESREDMASVYRERIGDGRLRAVAEHVR